MKSSKIKSELVQLEQALVDKIYKIGVVESAKMSGKKPPERIRQLTDIYVGNKGGLHEDMHKMWN